MAKLNGFKINVTVNAGCKSYNYDVEKKGGRKHNEALEGLDLALSFDMEIGELNVEGKEISEMCEGFAKAISETTRAEADKAFAQARARAEEARAQSEIRIKEEVERVRRSSES